VLMWTDRRYLWRTLWVGKKLEKTPEKPLRSVVAVT
jgi:hypothetical protein